MAAWGGPESRGWRRSWGEEEGSWGKGGSWEGESWQGKGILGGGIWKGRIQEGRKPPKEGYRQGAPGPQGEGLYLP